LQQAGRLEGSAQEYRRYATQAPRQSPGPGKLVGDRAVMRGDMWRFHRMIPERRRQNAAVAASWEDRLNKSAQRLVDQNHARMLLQKCDGQACNAVVATGVVRK
jgi:hypothetical protein